MAEPASTTVLAGVVVKFSTLIAGFTGGLVSLSYLRTMTIYQIYVSLLIAVSFAQYFTPAAIHLCRINPEYNDGTAFLIGLVSLQILPGFLALGRKFGENPFTFVHKYFKR